MKRETETKGMRSPFFSHQRAIAVNDGEEVKPENVKGA